MKQGNIFGRIGTGFGKGLAEQVPKELERNRLGSALKAIGEKKDQDPYQQFTDLVSAAHEYPQVVQSGANILRQKGMLKGLENIPSDSGTAPSSAKPEQTKPNPFDAINVSQPTNEPQPNRSITTQEGVQATIKPYIPKTLSELQQRAKELHEQNRALYPDYDTAMSGAQAEDQQKQAINQAQQGQRKGEQDVENTLRNQLTDLKKTAGTNVPDDIYKNIENTAIDEVASGEKSELVAAKDARDKVVEIDKTFENIKSFGGLGFVTNSPKALISSIESIRKSLKNIPNGLKNGAFTLIADNKISPELAFSMMKPVKEVKSLNDTLKSIPDFKPKLEKVGGQGFPGMAGLGMSGVKKEDRINATKKISPVLAKSFAQSKEASPLAIMHELRNKNYDPQTFKEYLVENQDILNMSSDQLEELQKTDNSFYSWLNDWWVKAFTGIK